MLKHIPDRDINLYTIPPFNHLENINSVFLNSQIQNNDQQNYVKVSSRLEKNNVFKVPNTDSYFLYGKLSFFNFSESSAVDELESLSLPAGQLKFSGLFF